MAAGGAVVGPDELLEQGLGRGHRPVHQHGPHDRHDAAPQARGPARGPHRARRRLSRVTLRLRLTALYTLLFGAWGALLLGIGSWIVHRQVNRTLPPGFADPALAHVDAQFILAFAGEVLTLEPMPPYSTTRRISHIRSVESLYMAHDRPPPRGDSSAQLRPTSQAIPPLSEATMMGSWGLSVLVARALETTTSAAAVAGHDGGAREEPWVYPDSRSDRHGHKHGREPGDRHEARGEHASDAAAGDDEPRHQRDRHHDHWLQTCPLKSKGDEARDGRGEDHNELAPGASRGWGHGHDGGTTRRGVATCRAHHGVAAHCAPSRDAIGRLEALYERTLARLERCRRSRGYSAVCRRCSF